MSHLGSAAQLAKIGLLLALEAPFRPRWAWYRARGYAARYLFNRQHQQRVGEYAAHARPLHEAVAYVTGRSLEEVRAADDSALFDDLELGHSPVQEDGSHYTWVVGLGRWGGAARAGSGPIEDFYGPSPQMLRLVNVVCRLLRPEQVLETGVAKGFASTAILDALDRNGQGRLDSIELPSLYAGYAKQVGERIPERLRERWQLHFGPSALLMPRVLANAASLDVFLHDSAANYDNQRTEFGIALQRMPAGGVLISNMVNSDALVETAESLDCRWAIVEQSKDFPLGILCRLS